MFDKLNEKRIYLDACFCGVVAFLLVLFTLINIIFNFHQHKLVEFGVIPILAAYILLIVYFGLKGLVPGLVAICECAFLVFAATTIISLTANSFVDSLKMSFSFIFSSLNVSILISTVTAGLITTLTRKRRLAVYLGIIFYIVGLFVWYKSF